MRLLGSELVGTASQELGWNILLKDLPVEKYQEYTFFFSNHIPRCNCHTDVASQWQNIDEKLGVHTWALPVIYVQTKTQEMGLIWGVIFLPPL